MSGPKTSTLEIEQRIRRQIEALRADAVSCALRAQNEISESFNSLEAQLASNPSLDFLLERAQECAQDARCRIEEASRFEVGFDLDQAQCRVRECECMCKRSIEEFHEEITSIQKACSDAQMRHHEDENLATFASQMKAASSEGMLDLLNDCIAHMSRCDIALSDDVALFGDAALSGNAAHNQETVSAVSLESFADDGAWYQRVLALARSAYVPSEDRASLYKVLCDLKRMYEDASESGEGIVRQLEILLPAMEARECHMREISASSAVLLGQLEQPRRDVVGNVPASFACVEDALAYQDQLAACVREQDEQRYIQACIDEVMRKHGYSISRSVVLSGVSVDASSKHWLFEDSVSSSSMPDGIHAFLSSEGDLMLEVVGVDHDLSDESDSPVEVSFAPTDSVLRQDALLQAQTDFCSVYAEIERDLAAYGIRSASRYRAEPSIEHCKVVSLADSGEHGSDQTRHDTKKKRRRAAPVAREMR